MKSFAAIVVLAFAVSTLSAQKPKTAWSVKSIKKTSIVRPKTAKDLEFLHALSARRTAVVPAGFVNHAALERSTKKILTSVKSNATLPLLKKVDRKLPCHTRTYFDTVSNDTAAYWKCSQSGSEWGTVGEWSIHRCAEGMHFVKRLQKCEQKQSKRRQSLCANFGANCPLQQQATFCPSAQLGLTGPSAVNTPCDWQTERLRPDPFSQAYFLQCVPIRHGSLCGKFIRMRCALQTTFSYSMQVCLLTGNVGGAARNACAAPQQAICQCGRQSRCPNGCNCVQNTCCTRAPLIPQRPPIVIRPPIIVQPPVQPPPRPPIIIRPPQPYCPGGVPGVGSCGACGTGMGCMQSTCCPLPTCLDGSPPRSQCRQGGICPLGETCLNGQSCCPVPLPQCPSGVPSIAPCNGPGTCPRDTNLFCYPDARGLQGCCPLPQCPNGRLAVAPCSLTLACPANTVCLGTGCCPLPMCPLTGAPAVGLCNLATGLTCPPNTACDNGVCCPLPRCPDGRPSLQPCAAGNCPPGGICIGGGCCALPMCPLSGQPAIGLCVPGSAGCPIGSVCSQSGGCCPLPYCPDGSPGRVPCTTSAQCGITGQCIGGVCCAPLVPVVPVQPQPVCPDGSLPQQQCHGVCPQYTQCYQGQCCPIPVVICPNGRPADNECRGPGQCTYGFDCFQGGCCEVARCTNGELSQGACDLTTPCSAPHLTCIDGACCPMQMCPGNLQPLQPCGGGLQITRCPTGFNCINGACCQPPISVGIPSCLDGGRPIIGSCATCTQPGYECRQGACCPSVSIMNQPYLGPAIVAPLAPYMQPQPTSVGIVQQPYQPIRSEIIDEAPLSSAGVLSNICPNGHEPLTPCSINGQCNAPGLVCLGGQCCPQLVNLCPNGQQASQICAGDGQSTCQVGFTCHLGGCCPRIRSISERSLQCEMPNQVPICYCAAYNFACPATTTCQGGICCASSASPLYNTVRPGDRCTHSGQCPGRQSACMNEHCVCVGNSRSNGVECVAWNTNTALAQSAVQSHSFVRRYKPGETCGQFAANCTRLVAEGLRRTRSGNTRGRVAQTGLLYAEMRSLGIRAGEAPLYWYTFTSATHYCRSDSDCTPDMSCINQMCLAYMTLFDRGCTSNQQCSRTVLSSHCEHDGDQISSSCQCLRGRFAYESPIRGISECVTACPSNTHYSGGRCLPLIRQMHRMSAAFATQKKDVRTSDKLQRLTGQIANLFSGRKRNPRRLRRRRLNRKV